MVIPEHLFDFYVWQKIFALPDLGLSLCISALQIRTPFSEGTFAKQQNYRHTVLELDTVLQISALVLLIGVSEVNCPCCQISSSVYFFFVPCSVLLIGLDREAELIQINGDHTTVILCKALGLRPEFLRSGLFYSVLHCMWCYSASPGEGALGKGKLPSHFAPSTTCNSQLANFLLLPFFLVDLVANETFAAFQ